MADNTSTVKFWIVTSPTQHSILADILFESDPKGIMFQALGGLRPENVLFVSDNHDDALGFAEEQLLRVSDVK